MSTKSLNLGISTTRIEPNCFASRRTPYLLNLPDWRLAPLRLQSMTASSSEPSVSSAFTSTVGSPPITPQIFQGCLTQRHFLVLSVIACSNIVLAPCQMCPGRRAKQMQ